MQEFHNFVTVLGEEKRRLAFLADALRVAHGAWCWDWVKIDCNDQAKFGGDAGKSVADFYSRGFPDGLSEQNNQVLEESEEHLEWGPEVEVAPGQVATEPILPGNDTRPEEPVREAATPLLSDPDFLSEIDDIREAPPRPCPRTNSPATSRPASDL